MANTYCDRDNDRTLYIVCQQKINGFFTKIKKSEKDEHAPGHIVVIDSNSKRIVKKLGAVKNNMSEMIGYFLL